MDRIEKALDEFANNCSDLLHSNNRVPTIEYSAEDPDFCLRFHRDYVAKNLPVKILHGYDDAEALTKWNSDYFLNHLGDKHVLVALTPNGYADGIFTNAEQDEIFALPEEVTIPFAEFLHNIQQPKSNLVAYIQKQDSNFTEDFQELSMDIDLDISWAHGTFGKAPDAVNFWMGDERAVTSMHKDFYENIYCVIDGHKDFILIPPTDLPWITYRNYKVGKFKNVSETEGFEVIMQKDEAGVVNTVPWIANDPLANRVNDERFRRANIYHVRVEKGECLYLPSLWFHHVRQSHGCIAVNYWYDMEFDVKFCYYQLLEKLCQNY